VDSVRRGMYQLSVVCVRGGLERTIASSATLNPCWRSGMGFGIGSKEASGRVGSASVERSAGGGSVDERIANASGR